MQMLRIYVGSRDRHEGRPLHEAIVEMARQNGLAGATVVRGMTGYGRSGTIRRASLRPRLNEFPLVIQIADDPARIAAFLPLLEPMVEGGLVTVQTMEGEQVRGMGRSAARKGTPC
jgi:hypothetical protein